MTVLNVLLSSTTRSLPTVQGLGQAGYAAFLILEAVPFPIFLNKEFNWDTELNRGLKGENEFIPSLSAFLFSFMEL